MRVLALLRSFGIFVTVAPFGKAFTPAKGHHEATVEDYPLFFEDQFWREWAPEERSRG